MSATQVFRSFDEFLATYFPKSDPAVTKAVLALANLSEEQLEDALAQHRRLRHVQVRTLP